MAEAEDLQKTLDKVRFRMEKLVERNPEKDGVRIHVVEKSKVVQANPDVTVELQRRKKMDSGREYWTSCFVSAACELSILERGKLFLATRYNIGVQGWSKDVESILYFVPTVIEAGEIMEKMVKDRFFKP